MLLGGVFLVAVIWAINEYLGWTVAFGMLAGAGLCLFWVYLISADAGWRPNWPSHVGIFLLLALMVVGCTWSGLDALQAFRKKLR